MQCVCWTPFIWVTINGPSETWLFVFGSAETAQKDACCVQMLDTRPELHACAELNCALSVQICIVCTNHLLFKRPSFIHQWRWAQDQKLGPDMEQRSQELGWDIVFPFSAISGSNSCWQQFSIPISTLMSLSSEGNLKRPGAHYGWCPHTVCLQECLIHSNFDVPQVLSTAILVPCLKSVPASLVWSLVTHQIWTNSGCAHHKLCAYAWWLHTCTLKVILIKLPAGCLSCEHSFPPPACKFCPQPSWLTFSAVLMEEATFRVPTFFISGDMYLLRYGQKSQLFVDFIQRAYWQGTQKNLLSKMKEPFEDFIQMAYATRNTTICHEKLEFLDG